MIVHGKYALLCCSRVHLVYMVNMLCCVAVRVHLVRVQVQQVFHDQEARRDLSRKEEQLLLQRMRLYW